MNASPETTNLGVTQAAMGAELNQNSKVSSRRPWRDLLVFGVVPIAAISALVIHVLASKQEPPLETTTYSWFLAAILGLSLLAAGTQPFWPALRAWMKEMCPLFGAALAVLAFSEILTAGVRWLPMPYFPSPAGVLQSMINDRALLFNSAWHSLLLLLSGYSLGVIAGLISGVAIGWFSPARYWGMPVLKILGPVPATALTALAMTIAPGILSAVALIAFAVWFPVTMLTASGISNTRASLLDVARTLGARQGFLIFRVAIPAAMPSIFIGLFMGLSASFLVLVVAESVGVSSGLGWYVTWAQGWAEYGKIFAALVIMSGFFSTVMTALFKLRDRVLVWQKGTIKW